MRGGMRMVLAGFVVSAALAAPGGAAADGILEKHKDKFADCQRPSYPRLTYWIPKLRRLKYCIVPPPTLEAYYSDRYSDIPPSYHIQKFPCSYAEPAALYDEPWRSNAQMETTQEAKP